MKLYLTKLSHITTDKGDVKVVGAMAPMSAAGALTEWFGEGMEGPVKPTLTALWRIGSDDPLAFTTWLNADLNPSKVDILVAEMNCRYLVAFADWSSCSFNIALRIGDEVHLHEDYHLFPWIKTPTDEQLIALLRSLQSTTAEEIRAARATLTN